MAHSLKLEVLLGAVDKATAPLKRVNKATKEAAQAMRSTRKELRDLNKAQGDIEAYRRADVAIKRNAQTLNALKQQTDKVSEAHAKAKTKQSDLKAEMTSAQRQFERIAKAMKSAGGHSSALSAELDKTRLHMDRISKAQAKASEEAQRHGRRLRTLGEQENRTRHQTDEAKRTIEAVGKRLREAGHDMQHLGRESRTLNQNETRLNDTLRTQRERLDKLRRAQERATAAREKFESVRNGAAVGGAAGVATGYVVGRGLHGSVDEAKDSENSERSLNLVGVSEEARKRLMQFADAAKLAGSSLSERRRYMVDAYTVLGDEHHAKMALPAITKMATSLKMQNPMMSEEEIDKLMMDTLKSAEWRPGSMVSAEAFEKALDYQQRVASASGGRVNGSSYNQFLSRAGIAAKGLSDEALYLKLEPFIQEMGASTAGVAMMSTYQNLYQGRVTKKAAQKMISLGLMDSKHVTFDKVGQQAFGGPGGLKNADIFRADPIEWVRGTLIPALNAKGITDTKAQMDAVGAMVSNRTAAQMISTMLLQVKDGTQDRRFRVNSNAKGLDDSYDVLRVSTSGREVETVARYHDLMRLIGEKVLPTYNAALEKINAHMVALSGWMTKHPRQAEMIVKVIMAFGAVAVVLGSLSMAFSVLSGPIMLVARCVMFLSSVLMANPIFALIAAIAIAAVLIYTYWGPIKKWFASIGIDLTFVERCIQSFWKEAKEAFHGGLWGILKLLARWSPIGIIMRSIVWAWHALMDWIMSKMSPQMRERLLNVIAVMERVWNGAWTWMKDIGATWMRWLTSAWNAVMEFLNGLGKTLFDAGAGLMTGLIGGFMAGWQEMMQKIADIKRAVAEAFEDTPSVEVTGTLNGGIKGAPAFGKFESKRSVLGGKPQVEHHHNEVNVHVHGVDSNNSAQVGREVARHIDNAMGQAQARHRSGMADRR